MPAEAPLTVMDYALLAQTYPGRPMITHHVLEHDAPLPREALAVAAEHLARHCPRLRSTVHEEAGRLSRVIEPFDATRARARVEEETGDWLGRPFALDREWPFRIRVSRTGAGAHALAFTLHHGVTDGRGALTLFDWFLRSALAWKAGADLPPCPFLDAPGPSLADVLRARGMAFAGELAMNTARSAGRFLQQRACLLEQPAAAPERVAVLTLDIAAERWNALGATARALRCTRNDLLWCAALRAADAVRRERGWPDETFRVVGGVDLRDFFGAADLLGNWVGTLEADFTPAEVRGPDLATTVSSRLTAARAPPASLVTPALLGLISQALSVARFREVFRNADDPRSPNMYSLLLSHIRPPGEVLPGRARPASPLSMRSPLCWPGELRPLRLWCASTLPRKPGLGITVTTVGEAVTLTACWPEPLSSERAVRGLLEGLISNLPG